MVLSKDNLEISELICSSIDNIKIKTDDFVEDIVTFISYTSAEMKKPNPKCYYYGIKLNQNQIGVIGLNILQTINEYKLGELHFCINEVDYIFDVLSLFLKEEILNNACIKIICEIDKNNDYVKEILLHEGFVVNKEEDTKLELKITKPLYLKK